MTAARLPELTEAQVTQQIKDFLESKGFYLVRLQSGTVRGITGNSFIRLGEKGIPDWIAVRGRDALFVEMKRPGGKLSQDQKQWFAWAEMRGILVLVADGLGSFIEKYQRIFDR